MKAHVSNIIKYCIENEPASMNNLPSVIWEKAKGDFIYDNTGKRYIDFTSGIFVANAGHGHPKIIAAIKECLAKPLLHSYYYPTKYRVEFTREMLSFCDKKFDKVLLLTTGSEAVEAAIKMALIKGKKEGKNIILSFKDSFHGKTMGAQICGGKEHEKHWIPFSANSIKAVFRQESFPKKEWPFFNDDYIFKKRGHKIAAIITEPYQGWSGRFIPKQYARRLRKFCDEAGALLISDEIQAGAGRTGKFFGFEHWGIQPDIIVCGKGISSSLPVSCVITTKEIADCDDSFNSTHGANPICLAAATENLRVIREEKLILQALTKKKILEIKISEWQSIFPENITEANIYGLMAAVHIKESEAADKIRGKCLEKGLLLTPVPCVIKIGPPLSIKNETLEKGLDIILESMCEVL